MLIIAFLILSISRPIVKGESVGILEDASSLAIVILIDDTFSNINEYANNSQIDVIKEKISLITKNYNDMNHIEISSINKDLLFNGPLKDIDLEKIALDSNYRDGNISELLIKYFKKSYTENYSSGHMYIISDMQKNSLEHKFNNNWWDIVFVNSEFSNSEPLITGITIKDKVIFPMKPFTVNVEVSNKGDFDISDMNVFLYIDGMQLIQSADILKRGSKSIEFKGVVDRRGSFDVVAELGIGSMKTGNKYFSKVKVFPRMNICLCNMSNFETIKYLQASISSMTENDIFSLRECSSNLEDLNTYDIVVVDEYKLLNSQEIRLYLNSGGHILFFPNLYLEKSISLDYLDDSAYLNNQNVTLFKENIVSKDILDNVFKYMSDDEVFSLKNKYLLPLGDESMIEIPGKGSVWNRLYIKNGLLDIFGFNLNTKDNDFALKGFFIPFMYSLLTSHNKVKPSEVFLGKEEDDFYVDTYLEKNRLLLVNNKKHSEIFNSIEDLNFRNVDYPGFYFLLSESDTIEEFVFNVSPDEFSEERINFPILNQNYNDSAILIKSSEELIAYTSKMLKSTEIWHIFLLAAIILLISESIIINVLSRKQ